MKMDNVELKRGDGVFCFVFGEGTVTNIANNHAYVEFAGKLVRFDSAFRAPRFSKRSLYWSNPVSVIPVPSPDDKAHKIVAEILKGAVPVVAAMLEDE